MLVAYLQRTFAIGSLEILTWKAILDTRLFKGFKSMNMIFFILFRKFGL